MKAIEWKVSRDPVPYQVAVREMEARVAAIRGAGAAEMVWLLEHPALYTAGTSARPEDLLSPELLPVHATGRGGQYTYHGPGQRIAYVMLDLQRRGRDLRRYVGDLEQWMIATLAAFGVHGERRDGRVGVWVAGANGREDKIAALGVRVRRWVSYHGIALNVDPNLDHYTGIVPCGIPDHGVTSLAALGQAVTLAQVDEVLRREFRPIFEPKVI